MSPLLLSQRWSVSLFKPLISFKRNMASVLRSSTLESLDHLIEMLSSSQLRRPTESFRLKKAGLNAVSVLKLQLPSWRPMLSTTWTLLLRESLELMSQCPTQSQSKDSPSHKLKILLAECSRLATERNDHQRTKTLYVANFIKNNADFILMYSFHD